MLVGFSCFCGFVCCKFQYINPRPLPESLSCFRHQVLQFHPGCRRGRRWDKLSSPAVPCHALSHSTKAMLPSPARAPPWSPVLTCARRRVALWLEPSLGSLGPRRGSHPRLWEQQLGSRQAPERAQAAQPGSGSAGDGEGAARSPWHRSGLQRVRGGQSAPRRERGEPGRHSRNNWRELLINLIITLSCVNTLHMQKRLKSAN